MLRYVDPRRFGNVVPFPAGQLPPAITQLGPDPLGPLSDRGGGQDQGSNPVWPRTQTEAFAAQMRSSGQNIKAFLLDQTRIAGLGNIYVCEALLRAGISPKIPANRCWRRAGSLLAAIRQVLSDGLANGGTSLRDYVQADGSKGRNQQALIAYGNEGLPCSRCEDAVIRRFVQAGRSTFYCPKCQRR